MFKKKNNKKKIKCGYSRIYLLSFVIATLFICVGYASINSVTIELVGDTYVRAPEGIFIQDAYISKNIDANISQSDIILYSGTMLNSNISLSETNIDSTITMTVEIYNKNEKKYVFAGVSHGEEFYKDKYGNLNTSIEYIVVNTTNETGILNSGECLTFELTFKYSDEYKEITSIDPYENILNSYLNFNFIEIPILELDNENETYSLNIYPGFKEEYDFVVSNYNETGINPTSMIYSFETVMDDGPLTAKIYDEAGNEITGNINIEGNGITKSEHKYTLKVSWDIDNKKYNYNDYKDLNYSCSLKLKAMPKSDVTLDYFIEKTFNFDMSVAEFYFNVSAEDNKKIINNKAILVISVNNYNSNTEYNIFDTEYEIGIIDNEKFTFSIDAIESNNNIITISGNEAKENNFNIILQADSSELNESETLTLKLISKKPYYKEFIFPITINLQPVNITYDANGGLMTAVTISSYNGRTYGTMPTPTRDGYTFDGWYTSKDGGTKYTSTSAISIDKDHTLYARWIPHLLTQYVKIGDYVDYKYVYYTNVATNSSGQYIPQDTYKNWRVLSNKDEDGDGIKEVRLVSAGVPLTYVFNKKATLSQVQTQISNITTNFFSTAISSTSTDSKFYRNGFYKLLENGTKENITTIGALKTAFTNELTKMNSSGIPLVQSLTKKDVDQIVGKTTVDADSLTTYYNNLLAIPSKDQSGKYASYYVADYSYYSSYAEPYHFWNSYYSGAIVGTAGEHGIRPVVRLKDTVVKIGGTGTNNDPYTLGI